MRTRIPQESDGAFTSRTLSAQKANGGDVEPCTPKQFADLVARAEGPLQVLIALGGLAGPHGE